METEGSGWIGKRTAVGGAHFAQAPCVVVPLQDIDSLTDTQLKKMYRKQRKAQRATLTEEERRVNLFGQAGSFVEAREDPSLDAPFFRVVRASSEA